MPCIRHAHFNFITFFFSLGLWRIGEVAGPTSQSVKQPALDSATIVIPGPSVSPSLALESRFDERVTACTAMQMQNLVVGKPSQTK